MSHNFLNFGRFLAFCFFVVGATSVFAQSNNTNSSSNLGTGNVSPIVGHGKQAMTNETELKLYPNPAQHLAVLQLPNSFDNGTLRIFNTTGDLMYENAVSSTTTLTFDNWQTGVYVLHLTTSTQNYQLKMLITQ